MNMSVYNSIVFINNIKNIIFMTVDLEEKFYRLKI